jgi:hypothetical protein
MDSIVDSLFDQYERGRMTRRHLVQALAALVLPANSMAQNVARAAAPIVRGLSVNHVALTVSDIPRSFAFYERLFGVTKGWAATNAGTGIHMDLADGYISIDSVAEQKGAITHFAVAGDHMDRDAANASLTRSTASCRMPRREMRISRIPGDRRSISGIPTACSCKSRRRTDADQTCPYQKRRRRPRGTFEILRSRSFDTRLQSPKTRVGIAADSRGAQRADDG